MVPNFPGAEATGTEKKVFSLLRGVDWGGVSGCALHSLNLAEHDYQRWGEIDFLVVGRPGLIAIEVKGGKVSCINGQWLYEDRLGRVVRRNKSPVVQAKDAFFSLDSKYISPVLGKTFSLKAPAGFCIILASTKRSELKGILGGPELPDALVGTSEDIASSTTLQDFLLRVSAYWKARTGASNSIHQNDVTTITQLLRPEFDRVHSLALTREQLGNEMLSLTAEQYSILDHWDGAKRILCSSPAGCGKTLLAVEMTQRLRASGEDVLLVVGSSLLADNLRSRPGLKNVVLGINELDALEESSALRVGTLIIDEGQQFLTKVRFDRLDAMLNGGLKYGKWAWFGDPNYQSSLPTTAAEECLRTLSRLASVSPRLTKNCRNTPEIISTTELASGVPLGHARVKGRGLHPKILEAKSSSSAATMIAEQIHRWVGEEVPLSSITILLDSENCNEMALLLAAEARLEVSRWSGRSDSSGNVTFASINDFRGLEAPFLILWLPMDIGEDERLARSLYLGMTRANFALLVVTTPSVKVRIQQCMTENALTATEAPNDFR